MKTDKRQDKNDSVKRFRIIFYVLIAAGIYILGMALYKMTAKREYWMQVSERFVKTNIPAEANRGNIYDTNGNLLAGSVPEYIIKMDFLVQDPDSASRIRTQHFRDSVFLDSLDVICDSLAQIFPDRDAAYFRDVLLKGYKSRTHAQRIYPRHATYIQYKRCKELPLFRESSFKGGFYADTIMQRKKPYGSLASRTIGDLYKDSDAAKNGLELSFDTILRGVPGISHRSKVRNRRVTFVDTPPQDGHDLVTTIDINMQDVAEKAIVNKLKEVGGDIGIVVLMEVKTGDVKAIVNMSRCADGNYYEIKNNAISDLMEPGSTFKTASIMVALEDGYITPRDVVDTGNGVYMMHGRPMKDHNWRRGGYGMLNVTQILMYSSNVGVSWLIDKYYKDHPEKFVDGLYRQGVGVPLNLPFVGKGEPRVRRPLPDGSNWSKTALPWMSIGYETMLPPISTLTFYNAIANNGKMVKPRFVKEERCDGKVVREFPTEVIKDRICSDHTLRDIQAILDSVVSVGLGKKAGNGGKLFRVSGKTGTAQMAQAGGYHSGTTRYMVSFCGYFPSEAPKYSCIVCIVKDGLPASGGGQCGPVFSEISQYVMANGVYREAVEASDSNSVYTPAVPKGNAEEVNALISMLNLKGIKSNDAKRDTTSLQRVPDVTGLGARDAVYAMQRRGLKVKINGRGTVQSQNIAAGSRVEKGKVVTLTLK